MARFWGAVILRTVLILWLLYVAGTILSREASMRPMDSIALWGTLSISLFLLAQTTAALAGYASIKSRVKKAKRDGTAHNHRP